MAKGVGGDFYSIKNIENKKWLMGICDVCGKGISASLISAIVGGMFDIYDFNNKSIEEFISLLNKYIYNTFKLEKYLTGLFIEFEEDSGKIRIFDMGHSLGASNLYLVRENNIISEITKNYNLAIGLVPDITTNSDLIELKKNDLFIAITDGVTDQRNSIEMEYGIKKFLKIITKNLNNDLKIVKESIFNDIDIFRGNSPQQDDITFLLLKYKGKS
ncbi:MAG TPA: PP2C family protein-serine/threonine phosphatase [Spirochaetota bacterium]|nr:PP2C family protein-serine/threonine phosphatase [Spirochaetota bacterium]HOL58018.1 PP2C family protein-serine/threonine phosphatase [Spirochaetota bacterium]HPP05651.1 PP2C family protein-serine/threonine phosphatase [Spirochaetota bacterium]